MDAREQHLIEVLSNYDVTFYIPPYQRNYEWEKAQCEVFFKDIVKTMRQNKAGIKSEHFFGTIVYVRKDTPFGLPDILILTDGQQRITTTMLFLVAMRDVSENETLQQYIDNKLLKNNNSESESEYKIKLKQVETDWEAYKNIILKLPLSSENKNSAVFRNYHYFMTELNKIKNDINLEDLISDSLNKFSVVTIELQPDKNPWENPQEVFESMNSLGKPLSLADLVRNYLLLGKDTDDQEKLYNNYWLFIEKKIKDHISDFIRDYMQFIASKNYKKATPNNYKELYVDFKLLFKSKDVENLLLNLRTFSEYYAYIIYGISTGNLKIDKKLDDIRSLGITIANSFLLGVISLWKSNDITDDELEEILDVTLIYFFRRRIMKLTQGENKTVPTFIKKLNRLINAEDKRQELYNIFAENEYALRMPNDKELIAELKSMNFYKFSYAKFLLSLIEENITKSRPDKSDLTLQLEHIMPKTLSDNWREELGEDYEEVHLELLDNIGNITLIRHNQELGNKPFTEKKELYKSNSGLQVTINEVTNRSKWNKNSIANRSKWISNYIVDFILPIPPEMKNNNNYNTKPRKSNLNFEELGIIGEEINYISNKNLKALVISKYEVEFEGEKWRLSPLTKELESRADRDSESKNYRGTQYWEFDGLRLSDLV